jgi:PDZ domain-containing protein
MSLAAAGSASPPTPEAEPRRPGGPARRTWVDRVLDPVRWEPGHERLAALPVFAGCSRADIRSLARAGDECVVPVGTVLCREGRIGYWLFVVTSGSVQLRTGAGRGAPVATLRAGSHFGEVAILGFGPQPVTAVVGEDASVFVLGRRYVLDLVHSMPGFRSGLFPGVSSDAAFRGVVREMREAGMAAWSALPRATVDDLLAGDRVEQLPPTLVAVPTRARAAVGGPSPFAAALHPHDSRPPTGGAVPAQPLDRRILAGVVGAVLAVVVAFGLLYHPDVLIVRPSGSIDVSGDLSVSSLPGSDVPFHPPRGRYIVTAVDIEETNVVGLLSAVVQGDEVVARAHDDAATVADPEAGRAAYRDSQSLAAALVARRAGVDPAAVRVRFRDRQLTGPSAGLVYALLLADMTDVVSVPRGRVVAATGELDAAGRVRAVGFVHVKRRVARDAGATVFVVPSGSVGADGAIFVSTLDEALAAVGS